MFHSASSFFFNRNWSLHHPEHMDSWDSLALSFLLFGELLRRVNSIIVKSVALGLIEKLRLFHRCLATLHLIFLRPFHLLNSSVRYSFIVWGYRVGLRYLFFFLILFPYLLEVYRRSRHRKQLHQHCPTQNPKIQAHYTSDAKELQPIF